MLQFFRKKGTGEMVDKKCTMYIQRRFNVHSKMHIQSTHETLNSPRPRPIRRHDAMHRVCTLQCCGQLNPLMEADLCCKLRPMETSLTFDPKTYGIWKLMVKYGEIQDNPRLRDGFAGSISKHQFSKFEYGPRAEATEVLPNLLGWNLRLCRDDVQKV